MDNLETYRYPNGKLLSREYHNKKGQWHREGDLPAFILYNQSGKCSLIEWYKNGKLHREGDKPAAKNYIAGNLSLERWAINGKLHREGGRPAYIIYGDNGNIVYHEYWVHGKKEAK